MEQNMDILKILKNHTIETIQMVRPQLTEKGATRLFDVHVALNHFAMPIHSRDDEKALISLCESDCDIRLADEILHFENTRSSRGICRVMARTHLNCSGINDISMGSPWKTQSPRLLTIFDAIQTDNDLRAWAEYTPLIETWIQVARDHRGNPGMGNFDEQDIESLEALLTLTPEQARTLPKTNLPYMPKQNWARVARGVYTGVRFLVDRYEFNADEFWRVLEGVRTLEDVNRVAGEAQRAIRGYGPALAPSFFADLGNAPHFVKPDTHVVDVSTWALGRAENVSHIEAVEYVHQIAHATGLLPRQVDKYMFFACSCNMYLAGIHQGDGFGKMRKIELRRKFNG
jgi:hypothetical protein